MAAVLMFLFMVPLGFGYFLGTVFAPLVFLSALILSPVVVLLAPFYILFKSLRTTTIELVNPEVLGLPTEDEVKSAELSLIYPHYTYGESEALSLRQAFGYEGHEEAAERLIQAQNLLESPFLLQLPQGHGRVGWVVEGDMGSSLEIKDGEHGWEPSAEPTVEEKSSGELEKPKPAVRLKRRHEGATSEDAPSSVSHSERWWHWSFDENYYDEPTYPLRISYVTKDYK